ncbi:hypothetical protein AB1Y20_013851 [Prymnesium parvum]|uniref:Uncharacterized protein n=1 Tax=Prymnesium parvum TaxID=97485 RepID=A0AB34IGY9_PRYPA
MAVARALFLLPLLAVDLSHALAPPRPTRSATARPAISPPALLPRRAATHAAIASLIAPLAAHASGGATAGRTTSIPRAKLRYSGRLTAAVKAFLVLKASIGTDEQKKAGKAFFSDAEDSAYSELKTAGYLLAVAFKIDAKVPPDKLETVKAFKKLMKDLEELKKGMDGKPADAEKAFGKASESLNLYLEGVELPLLDDSSYSPA